VDDSLGSFSASGREAPASTGSSPASEALGGAGCSPPAPRFFLASGATVERVFGEGPVDDQERESFGQHQRTKRRLVADVGRSLLFADSPFDHCHERQLDVDDMEGLGAGPGGAADAAASKRLADFFHSNYQPANDLL